MAYLDDGLSVALDPGSRKYIAEAQGLRGGILLAARRAVESRRALRRALALAEAIACPGLTWRLVQSLGRAYEQRGDIAQAHATYKTDLNAVTVVTGRVGNQHLRNILLASPQVTSSHDDLGRLDRLGA